MLMTKMFSVGYLSTNCYVVNCRDTKQAVIIDPGFTSDQEADKIISFIKSYDLKLKFIVNTHGHPDHASGNELIKRRFNVPICVHKDDAYMFGESGIETARYFGYNCVSPPADILLVDHDYVKFGDVALKVIHSPGHSRGSVLLVGETELFSGDTLFAGSIGRTDFPESSDLHMQISLKRLLQFPDYFLVYSGHGPSTTIADERRVNPFLQNL